MLSLTPVRSCWICSVLVGCLAGSTLGGDCPAPVGVQASDGDVCNGITLTWQSVQPATAYIVWRSDQPDLQTAAPVAQVSSTTYTDTAVGSGESFYYWLQSECSPFTGPFSDVVLGTAGNLPLPPQQLSATQGTQCDGVLLSWDSPPAGTEYRIYRATVNDFAFAQQVGSIVDAELYLDESAPASTEVSSLWFWVRPVTACGEGDPVAVEGWRCVPEPTAVGVPNAATSNWRGRAAATLFNACRVGPQDFRDFFFAGMSGLDQVLQPQNYSALPPLQWSEELAAAANYHAIDVSTVGCDAFEFNSCNGATFGQRIFSFLSVSPGIVSHLPTTLIFDPAPPQWAVEAMENPGFHLGVQILGSTVPLPDNQNIWMRDYIFDSFSTSSQFGFGISTETAYNGLSFGSVEKMQPAAADPSKIVIASHTPDYDNENILYVAIYHDTLGVGPQAAQVEINGEWISLGLMSGTSSSGAFYWSEPMCDAADPCRQYRFRFVTALGEELLYPEVGVLGAAGLPCDCEAEYFDEFETPCPGDLNSDGVVDVSDLLILLGDWGACSGACPGDLNDDGVVDVSDLLILLGNWGSCPR